MISISPGSNEIDAITSATEKYYSSRGLTATNIISNLQSILLIIILVKV